MKPAKDLIRFEKHGKEFPYRSFDLHNYHCYDGINALIDFFPRDEDGNKIPIRHTRRFVVTDIKADKLNPSKMILVIDEL